MSSLEHGFAYLFWLIIYNMLSEHINVFMTKLFKIKNFYAVYFAYFDIYLKLKDRLVGMYDYPKYI